jgi:hypothetical protein
VGLGRVGLGVWVFCSGGWGLAKGGWWLVRGWVVCGVPGWCGCWVVVGVGDGGVVGLWGSCSVEGCFGGAGASCVCRGVWVPGG